jgi:hypothetical protein
MAAKEEIVKLREPAQRNQGKIPGSTVDTYLAIANSAQSKWRRYIQIYVAETLM